MGSDRLVIALVGMNLVLGTTLLVQGRRASAANDPETLRARAIELGRRARPSSCSTQRRIKRGDSVPAP